MNINKSLSADVEQLQSISIYPALDAGYSTDSEPLPVDESRLPHITAGVSAVKNQGLNVQIKSWLASLNISRKQSMELLRMRKDILGRESDIVRSIKSNYLIPKVAGIVDSQLRGRVVVPTSEPYVGSSNKVEDEFKLNIPKQSEWRKGRR